ncbi:MAG: BamA/TamA family outer membrane protein [Chitinophagaceae bacterium]|nr:BamA/TamA family outer membrane protein [Chitinophagaceae bacterium]
MTKLQLQISVLVCLLFHFELQAQNDYRLTIRSVDKDSAFLINDLAIPVSFPTRFACEEYVNRLPSLLQAKGYVTASLDSVRYDSTSVRVVLFAGDIYKWASVDASQVDISVLQAIGWREKMFNDKPMDFSQVEFWQNRILNYLENNGYPFARVYLDSLQMDKEKVWASMKLDKGPLYKIDSIRIVGNAKIANEYLQRYLDIRNGSIFSREKLLRISKRMKELSYVEEEQPSKLIWLGNGSILEMYLKQKRSSQVNVLVGFLPNNDQLSSKKLLVTGEANMNFKNALGAGETIGLNWQQLQVKSPRLNFLFQYPYLFHSPVGLDFAFDIFRKDSTFSNINMQLGAQYVLNIHQSGKLFLQRFQTIVNGINTNYILQNRQLPDEADVSSLNLGLDYEFNNTNYRLNPTSGNELRVITSAGTKKLKKNNLILDLEDPGDPSYDFDKLYDTVKLKTYQFRVKATAAKYFPVGKQNKSTLKTAINAGFFQSGNIFRNELFQIGGYKTLRGFDEESQYLSQFAIATVEYRLLIDQNSFFYVLADGGWGRNNSQSSNASYTYFGTGLGLAFDAKAGIFNLAWAVGKRNDTEFNLRQSKIHIGFVSYF